MRSPCLALALVAGCASPELVATIEDRPDVGVEPAMFDCAFGPDGSWLATTCAGARVRVWDARDGAWLQDLPLPPDAARDGGASRLAISPAGERLAQGCPGAVRLYALPSRRHEGVAPVGTGVTCAALEFARSGPLLLVGGSEGVWWVDPDRRVTVAEDRARRGEWFVALSDGGVASFTARAPGVMCIDRPTEVHRELHVPWFAHVGDAALAGDALLLAGRGVAGRPLLVLLDLAQAIVDRQLALETEGAGFAALCLSPDGARAALAGPGALVTVVDLTRMAVVAQLRGHDGDVRAVAWSPTGDRLASVGADGTARLWRIPR